MTTALDTLKVVAERRRAIEAEYREALQAARDAGFTGSAIGEAAGTSRQNVLKLTVAPVTVSDEVIEARLLELDARWERFVDQLAAAFFVDPDAKREQLKRNQENGKRSRKHARAVSAGVKRGFSAGGSAVKVPTVKSDARRAAETFALRYLDENAAHPVCVKVIGELDEAAALREKITSRLDPGWLHA